MNDCVSNPRTRRDDRAKVESGLYASASEVVREALRLLDERDRLIHLRQDIRLGLDELDQGQHRPFDG